LENISISGHPSTKIQFSDKLPHLSRSAGGAGLFSLTQPVWQEMPLRLVNSSISHTVVSGYNDNGLHQIVGMCDLDHSQRECVRQYEEENGCGVGYVINRLRSGEVSGACYSLGKRGVIPSRKARIVSDEFTPAARKKIRRVFDCNRETFKTFISLTFDCRIAGIKFDESGHVDHKWAKSHFEGMIRALSEKYRRLAEKTGDLSKKFTYLWVVEIQKGTGNIHFHMVTNKAFIPADYLRKLWRYGSVDIVKVKDSNGAGSYLRKYIQKGACTIQGNRYNMSADLHETIKPLRINLYGRSVRNRVLVMLSDMKNEIESNGGRVYEWGFHIPAARRSVRYRTKQGFNKVTKPVTTGQISSKFLVAITQLLDSNNPQAINLLTNELESLPF
jgi:hypothetical protein